MNMAYTKLDAGITDSTIWQAPDATRLVWITMLAMADQNGYVGASMPGLAGRARVALDACIEAISTLESPDEWSRTKEHEGRRIAPADGGWILLNHAKYRAKQDADDRRERSRVAMAELRAKRKLTPTKANGYQVLTELTLGASKLSQAEAEAEADAITNTVSSADEGFASFWKAWPQHPRKVARKQCQKKWADMGCEKIYDDILDALFNAKRSDGWTKDGGAFIPSPLVWLNQARWEAPVVVKPDPAEVEQAHAAAYQKQLAASIAAMRK